MSLVYDCFAFFNELDILEIRLNELKDVVDKFVLVEATKTHSGLDKPLYYRTEAGSWSSLISQGAATVVVKLLSLVQPDVASFGEKDYQQLTIIRHSVDDLCLPVKIVGATTVRAEDGLALSSRNRYLSAEERVRAPQLYRALDRARRRLETGDGDITDIEREGLEALRAAGFRPDYVEVRMPRSLARPKGHNVDVVLLAAARLSRARLIDNLQCRASGAIAESG